MTGIGSFGQGSSTLSPLAPPFTVNRSAPNPITSPPPRPFLDNYLPSRSTSPTLLSNSFSHLNRDVVLAPGFAQFDSQSIDSCGAHLPSLSTTHDFSYVQHSESMGNNVIGIDPYYLQYSSALHNATSSIMEESGYVILNSGVSAPLEGSSRTDYIQSSTGFGCAPRWTGQWNDVDASSVLKEPQGKMFSPYRSSLQLGAPTSEGFMSCEGAPGIFHEHFVESSTRKVYIGSKGTGPERIDAKHSAVSEANVSGPSFNIPGPLVLAPPTIPETLYSHLPDPSVLVPSTIQETMYSHLPDPFPTKAWNPFNQNTVSFDGCFTPLDSCTTEPTIFYPSTTVSTVFCPSGTTQPAPPASGSSLSLGKVVLKDKKFCNWPTDAYNKRDSVSQVSVKVREPCVTLMADTRKIKNDMGICDRISMEPSPAKGLTLTQIATVDNSLHDLSKKEIELKLTHLKLPEASTNAPAIDGLCDSVQSSDANDQFILAVDSPCWKGASSRRSPFTVVDAEAPISFAKEPEGCKVLNHQDPFLYVNADGVEAVSSCTEPCGSLKNHEARDVDNSSFTMKPTSAVCSLLVELEDNDAEKKSESYCFKADNENGAQCSDGFLNKGNDSVLANSTATSAGLITSDFMPSSYEDVSSAMKLMPHITIKEPVMDFIAAQDGSSDLHSHKEHASNSSTKGQVLEEANEIFRAADMSSHHSVARSDVSILVKTIHNLSELLRYSHDSDANAFKENDYEAICLVINNLVGLVRHLPNLISGVGSSYCVRESTDPHEGTTAGRHLATEIESDDFSSLGNHQSFLCREGIRKGIMQKNFCRSCKRVDKAVTVSRSDEMDFDEDVGIIQAFKKVMKGNISECGEHYPQSLLYKNLWIEAEAALCSLKYKLQLARMQIVMEKSEQHQTKDFQVSKIATGKTIDVKNLFSVNTAADIDGKEKSAFNVQNSLTKYTTNKSRRGNTSGIQHLGVNCTGGNDSVLDASEKFKMARGSCVVGVADEAVTWSRKPAQLGNWLPSSGYDSYSCDWEHLFK